ncbi:MAG: aspartyl/asparaginyl beta-hydroxylase domain-containing protein [Steroidobacteraceae bacterium]
MDIGVPLKSFGQVEMAALAEAILAQDELAWNENVQRQKDYEVHEQTRSIVLLFAEVSEWPAVEVSKQPGWERLAQSAVPVMHEIIGKWYPPGGTIIRAMAAKLLAGGRILPHRDSHPSFGAGHRIHVPIVTNPRVRFMIDGRPFNLEVGQAYEINNQKVHSVMNKGDADRINFIFDYVPPGTLPGRASSPARTASRASGS